MRNGQGPLFVRQAQAGVRRRRPGFRSERLLSGAPVKREAAARRRRYVRFTRWRRSHFFRVLEETGHAQMAAAAAGVSLGCIYRLRRLEPGFTAKMKAAVAEADRRLEGGQCGDSHVTVTELSQALVIRKGIGGRLRVMAAGRHWWTE